MTPGRYVINETTGSTGRPLQILTTVESAALSRNVVSERLFQYLDLPDTGTVFNLGLHYLGQPFFEPKALPRPYVQCNLRAYDPDRAEIVADYEAVVGRVPVDYIHGSSSRIILLARYCAERGIRLEPRGIVATYEHMPAGGRKLVEETFGCPVTMLYCTSEIGYAAWECSERRMHFHEDFVQCEIFPASGKVREGGVGDIILTSLLSGPMPIIRYVTGDLAAPATHCPCGLPGTVIDELLGRDGARLVGIEGAAYSPYALLAALTATGLVEFQLVQESPGVVQVVAPNASASEREAITHIDQRLRAHFGSAQGFSVALSASTSFIVSGRGKRNPVVQLMDIEIGNTEKTGYIRPIDVSRAPH
ncbi:phenylacetate-coenzyme A ligase PaaK-like adenylate-forming protein [Streptomyces sp. Ag109_O5-1]|nr:phenylacetate-coenzyme A ligase PaaK-like adenylate-forming protein [Streptomyces sp. Ag109_O5-1]